MTRFRTGTASTQPLLSLSRNFPVFLFGSIFSVPGLGSVSAGVETSNHLPGPSVMKPFTSVIELAGIAMEAAGVAVIVIGAAISSITYLVRLRKLGATKTYAAYRVGLARSILLGLELLVAGDIIRTVVVAPTLQNVGLLAAIVLIRTFLSFTLELEVTGSLPWQRANRDQQHEERKV